MQDVILDGQCNVRGFSLAKMPASGPLTERKAIALGAITSVGSKTSPMITNLAQAESMDIVGSVEAAAPKGTAPPTRTEPATGTGPLTGTGTST